MPMALATAATERSISAVRITKVRPTAMMPVIDIWRRMFSMLSSVRKEFGREAEEHDEDHQREDRRDVAQLVGQEALQVEALGRCRVCRRHCRFFSLQSSGCRQQVGLFDVARRQIRAPPCPCGSPSRGRRATGWSRARSRARGWRHPCRAATSTMRITSSLAPTSMPRVGSRQDQHARQVGEPLGQRHLLLVAARQRAQRNRRSAAA